MLRPTDPGASCSKLFVPLAVEISTEGVEYVYIFPGSVIISKDGPYQVNICSMISFQQFTCFICGAVSHTLGGGKLPTAHLLPGR